MRESVYTYLLHQRRRAWKFLVIILSIDVGSHCQGRASPPAPLPWPVNLILIIEATKNRKAPPPLEIEKCLGSPPLEPSLGNIPVYALDFG